MKEFGKLSYIIKNTFVQLCDEYHIPTDDCTLSIETDVEMMYDNYHDTYTKYAKTTEDLFDLLMKYYVTMLSGRLAHSNYYNIDGKIKYAIYISEHTLKDLIIKMYEKHFDENTLIEYLKMTVRHEVGHILHYMSVINEKGYEAGHKYLDYQSARANIAYKKFIDKLHELYEEDEDLSDYDFAYKSIKNYYSHKIEKMPNKLADVNLKEYIKLSLRIEGIKR